MTFEETYSNTKEKLKLLIPEIELKYKAELIFRINQLKKEKKAIVLGHNYMEPALYYTITDYVGDSLELSKKTTETESEVIVFCGVRFMAESAKILNPKKKVLLPSLDAGCSLAASITADDVRVLKRRFPGVPVVSYVNTYAEVKAESDICCTASNAAAIIEFLESQTIIFIPDEYLAKNVAKETGKHIIFPSYMPLKENSTDLDYQIIGWNGKCEVHEKFNTRDILNIRKQFPDVVVLAHPECNPEVVEECDFSGSTKQMISFVEKTSASHYLILTECSIGDNIIAANPDKNILRLCNVRCPHMNQITLEETLKALLFLQHKIEIPEPIRLKAFNAVKRMIEVG